MFRIKNSAAAGEQVNFLKRLFAPAALSVLLSLPLYPAGALGDVKVTARENRADKTEIQELEFKDAQIKDAIRVISELTGVNIVATEAAGKKLVTMFIRDLTVSDAIDSMSRVAGVWYRYNKKTGVYIVMTTEEYRKDIVVFREESTRLFSLEYLNVGIAARTIADLFGDRVKINASVNAEYGDDFKISGLDVFGGDEESETGGGRVGGGSQGSNRSGQDGQGLLGIEDISLTPEQIAALDVLGAEGTQRISEQLIGRVTQHKEAPIYVTINRLHNLLFVRTSDDTAMKEIVQLVEQSDQPVRQVLLEMKVLEVKLTDAFNSAFDFSYIGGSQRTGPDDGSPVNPLNPLAETAGSAVLGLGNFGLQTGSTMIFQLMNEHIRMRVQILEQDGNINTLATPMLLASNNRPARIFIGEQMVLTTGFKNLQISGGNDLTITSTPTPETEVQDVGNTLTILPSINADNSVVMRLIHENSTPNIGGGRIPVVAGGRVQEVTIDTVNTSKMEGTVLAKDGYTVAIGGMMRTAYTDNESRVPLLGDIPLLGAVFRQTDKSQEKSELVLLITPHVLSTPEESEAVSRQRLSDLTEHPNGLDLYLDKLDESRKPKDMATGPSERGSMLEENYITLTRYAAKMIRTPKMSRPETAGITRIRLRDHAPAPLVDDPRVEMRPMESWRQGALFITAVKIENLSDEALSLDESRFRGTWLAATLEKKSLAAGSDATYAYLISGRPFHRAIGAALPVAKPPAFDVLEDL